MAPNLNKWQQIQGYWLRLFVCTRAMVTNISFKLYKTLETDLKNELETDLKDELKTVMDLT